MMHGREKSDPAIVAKRPVNKAALPAAESVERRAGAEGNARQQSTHRTQCRARVTQALDRVRKAAKERKKEQFTALLHHVSTDALQTAFYALKRKAAPGVDGMTWQEYEADLDLRLEALHKRIHQGAYRPHSSPHFVSESEPQNSPLCASISANLCISGRRRCSGMFGISS